MSNTMESDVPKQDALIESLLDASSYVHSIDGPIRLHETHISWVLLAGNYAYKIKKPVINDFIDYGTLAKRHHACCEELRLGNRYAMGLYLDVVPISFEDGQVRMDGDAQPIEFAVRMRRFEDDSLLSHQLEQRRVTTESMVDLAKTVAKLHAQASRIIPPRHAFVSKVYEQAIENFELLQSEPLLRQDPLIQKLLRWTEECFEDNREHFENRTLDGSIRECHGDLHCDNIVLWHGQLVPFDGIEFNVDLTWIDVLSDVAFLVMDLQERGHAELASIFLNAYLEQTGDYQSLAILRWYMIYRALVRAKVAVLRARQQFEVERLNGQQISPAIAYLRLAESLTKLGPRKLWITHGVSGSGKTFGSLQIVQQEGAVRIRSDVERKRLFKTCTPECSDNPIGFDLYSPTASEATYSRLHELAQSMLRSDMNVVVDATFLRKDQRKRFQDLAHSQGAEFFVLDFHASEEELKSRVERRRIANNDASDATLAVLTQQLRSQDPLTADEREHSISL